MTDDQDGTIDGDAAGLSRELLEILVCPRTGGKLVYDRDRQELVSKQAGLAYPVRNGIPVMLEEEARVLDDDTDMPF